MINSQDYKSVASNLKGIGFCKLKPSPNLKKLIKDFFYDICRYTLLVCKDSKAININGSLGQNLIKAIEYDDAPSASYNLNSILMDITKIDRSLIGHIYDMGTRPTKFSSARVLACSRELNDINLSFFRLNKESSLSQPLIIHPPNGETLHLFPPGQKEYKYNLPIHQDFPYLLQSPSQLTYWLNLSNQISDFNGGVRLFSGTHKYKIPITKVNELGYYEVADLPNLEIDSVLKKHEYVDTESSLFELYAIDSLLWHQSLKSNSKDTVRMTYIFRYSDISSNDRLPFGVDTSKGETFEKYYPEFFRKN